MARKRRFWKNRHGAELTATAVQIIVTREQWEAMERAAKRLKYDSVPDLLSHELIFTGVKGVVERQLDTERHEGR